MKYTVVTSSRFDDLIKMVNELIETGWLPQGVSAKAVTEPYITIRRR